MTINRDKLIQKIKALMSKTVENGCTEAEAMAALSMAQAMMDAYEVTEDEVNQTKQESAEVGQTKDMRDPHNIKNHMGMAISEFTNTKIWTSNNKKTLNYCGLISDVDFALWLTEHLTLFVQRELKNYIWAGGYTSLEPSSKRRVINGFVYGCTIRINQRLRELVAQGKVNASTNANALVVVKNELINRKMQELDMNLRMPRNRGSYYEPDGYAAGKAAGDKANFGRPVESGQQLRLK